MDWIITALVAFGVLFFGFIAGLVYYDKVIRPLQRRGVI